MITELDKRTSEIADLIINEFQRLGLSTEDDPCSGLLTRVPSVVTDLSLVEVYDDYTEGTYDGEGLLALLETLSPEDVSLESEALNNIWQVISDLVA